MEIKFIICFSCVIPTINFQQLRILLVTLLLFIVEYIFLKQFVKLLMMKYADLLIILFNTRKGCLREKIIFKKSGVSEGGCNLHIAH